MKNTKEPIAHKTLATVKSIPARRGASPEQPKGESCSAAVLHVRQMAEQAATIRDHIANGGKPDELSGIKFLNPTGLFDQ